MNHKSLSERIILVILIAAIVSAGCTRTTLLPKIMTLDVVDGRFEISVLDLNRGTRQYVTDRRLIYVNSYSYCDAKKQVAYSAWIGSGQEIIFQDVVTADKWTMTKGVNHFRLPDWSPDCSKLAFTSDDLNPSVFIFNVENSTTDPLPVEDGSFLEGASWSPNSHFLATHVPVPSSRKSAFHVGIIDIASHKLTELQGLADYPISDSVWNAESDKLYFSARQESSSFDLYEFDINKGVQTPVVQTEFDDRSPALSADGAYLSFLRSSSMPDRYLLGVYDFSSGRTELITTTPRAISAILWVDHQQLILSEYDSFRKWTLYYVVDIKTKTFRKIARFDGQFIKPELMGP